MTAWPRAALEVYAMGRPRRPDTERQAVVAAAGTRGSAAQRARRVALAVAVEALRDMDGPAADRVLLLLAAFDASPIAFLATDPEIDTAAILRTERAARLAARCWRRPTDAEWSDDDRRILAITTLRLTKRYQRHLARFQP